MIIAIDGPAGTGKSTIAAIIADKLHVTYLNSGSFYRGLTLALLESGTTLEDEKTVVDFCSGQKLEYRNSHLILNGKDVESRLHEDVVSAHVAQLSALPEIRHIVNARMRDITHSLDIVCEGRDMTSFPMRTTSFTLTHRSTFRLNGGSSRV